MQDGGGHQLIIEAARERHGAIVADYLAAFRHHGPEPWAWQADAFLRSAAARDFCFFSEPRCGKSKPLLATAVWRYLLPPDHPLHTNAVCIVAMPYNVPTNWARVEIPKHVPPEVNPRVFIATTDELSTKRGEREMERMMEHDGLAFLLTNGEAVLFDRFLVPARHFFKTRVLGLVGDESSLIMKTYGTKRQKKMWAMRRMPNVRWARILDGTPAGEGPTDLYAQVGFLSKSILGFDDLTSFENHYCEFKPNEDAEHRRAWMEAADRAEAEGLTGEELIKYADRASRGFGRTWKEPLKDDEGNRIYKNIEALWGDLGPHSVRIRRRDVYDGPDKVYQKAFFQLTKKQRAVYDRLRDEYEVELETVQASVPNVLTRIMRLQQVARNYFPSPDQVVGCAACGGEDAACPKCEGAGFLVRRGAAPAIIDAERNPAMEVLLEAVRKGQRTAIWTRFHHEADDLMRTFIAEGWNPKPFHGGVKQREREETKDLFNLGRVNPLIGTPRTGSRGVTIAAELMAFFNNEYSLLTRLQSEDRPEVPGLLKGVEVLDVVGVDTRDEDIIDALRGKRRVSDAIFHERSGRWL